MARSLTQLAADIGALRVQVKALRDGFVHVQRVSGTPEGALVGALGDLAVDVVTGSLYRKAAGAGTATGWVVV